MKRTCQSRREKVRDECSPDGASVASFWKTPPLVPRDRPAPRGRRAARSVPGRCGRDALARPVHGSERPRGASVPGGAESKLRCIRAARASRSGGGCNAVGRRDPAVRSSCGRAPQSAASTQRAACAKGSREYDANLDLDVAHCRLGDGDEDVQIVGARAPFRPTPLQTARVPWGSASASIPAQPRRPDFPATSDARARIARQPGSVGETRGRPQRRRMSLRV